METEKKKAVSVTVKNDLPSDIAVISAELMVEISALTAQVNALVVNDIATLELANGSFKKIDALAKAIAANRLEITRPIDAMKRAIIAAEDAACGPLLEAKKSLGQKIVICQRELQRIADEAARKARLEAEEKARIERARLEAERQELLKKQEAERLKAEADRAEAAKLFGEDALPELPFADPVPPPPVFVPIVLPPPPPSIPKSAARTTTRQTLVIFDENLVPLTLAGVCLRIPDEKAILKLLKAGVPVPGARLDSVESIGASGGRK